jgi:hypothetical protein
MKKKTKNKTCCSWCLCGIIMQPGFNEKKHKPFCSQGCRDAEMLFNQLFSDEQINRNHHYDELTKGE